MLMLLLKTSSLVYKYTYNFFTLILAREETILGNIILNIKSKTNPIQKVPIYNVKSARQLLHLKIFCIKVVFSGCPKNQFK